MALQQLALLRCRGGRGLVNILLPWREEETTELISFVCRPRSAQQAFLIADGGASRPIPR